MPYRVKQTFIAAAIGLSATLGASSAALAAGLLSFSGLPAGFGTGNFPESSRRLCFGDYAFCSAATCTPTGKLIAVNTATGHAWFPAAECTCPILHGVDEVARGAPGSDQVKQLDYLTR